MAARSRKRRVPTLIALGHVRPRSCAGLCGATACCTRHATHRAGCDQSAGRRGKRKDRRQTRTCLGPPHRQRTQQSQRAQYAVAHYWATEPTPSTTKRAYAMRLARAAGRAQAVVSSFLGWCVLLLGAASEQAGLELLVNCRPQHPAGCQGRSAAPVDCVVANKP